MFIPRNSTILLLASWLCASAPLFAQPKIGTVDVERIIESCWKSSRAEEELQAFEQETLRRHNQIVLYQRADPSEEKRIWEIDEPGVQKRRKEMRSLIGGKILIAARQCGAEEGFDLIFDTSANRFSVLPTVLHGAPRIELAQKGVRRFDLTQTILDKLDAPPSVAARRTSGSVPKSLANLQTTTTGMYWDGFLVVAGMAALVSLIARTRRPACAGRSANPIGDATCK